MKFAIIKDGVVSNIAVANEPLEENWVEVVGVVDIGYLWSEDKGFEPPPPPVLTYEQFEVIANVETQVRLDAFAQTRNYDSMLSLCSYATSAVANYAQEGQYGISSRDATWETLNNILDQIKQGLRPIPSYYSEIEPELPVLEWPI